MLDSLLGNVFGRSKKDKNSNTHNNNNTNNPQNGENSEGFVVLGQQSTEVTEDIGHSLYPRVTTMLTQEMIVGQTSQVGGAHSMSTTVVQRTTERSFSSPIDNIPFSPVYGSGQELVDNNSIGISKCFETIDRIQQYLSTESQSQYNFQLENTILSESLLS